LYLKRLEIQGFKSFADKTIINFDKRITAIVGPNGSGKSNIADSLRWVLGEQSIKNLRGTKMEDIIFSGTDKRKPLGFAEVIIVFDNSDNFIPLDYTEISVSRRMYRSGDSEFFINKNPCRLKDIKELFSDTGIGKEGYSIISQGKIEDIISTNPENRKLIFEEAAGIVRYKLNRQDALKKLEKTNANILRISDLISEINNQVISLKSERDKAIKYKSIFDEIKNIDLIIAKKNYCELVNEVNSKIKNLKYCKEEILNIEKKVEKLINDEQEFKTSLIELDKTIDEKRNLKLEVVQNYEKNRNLESLLIEKISHNNDEIERLKKEIATLDESIDTNKNDIHIIKGQIEEIKDESNKCVIEISNLENIKIKLGIDLENVINQLKKSNEKVLRLHSYASEIKSEIYSLETFVNNIKSRIEKIDNSIHEYINIDNNLSIEISSLESKLNNLDEKINNIEKKIMNLNIEYSSTEGDLLKYEEQLLNLKQAKIKASTTLKLHQELESNFDGYYNSTKEIIKLINTDNKYKEHFIGIVNDLFIVERKYLKAIETSLGSSIQNIVVKDEYSAKIFINYLKEEKKGRATFLPVNGVNHKNIDLSSYDKNKFGILGLANDLISYDSNLYKIFSYLLGKTIIIENLDKALEFNKFTSRKYRIVTLDGDLLSPGGSITGGHKANENQGILARKVIIEELNNEIKKIDNNLKSTQQVTNNLAIEKQKIYQNIKELKDEYNSLSVEMSKLRNQIEQKKSHQNISNKELVNKRNEYNDLLMECERLEEKISKLKTELNKTNIDLENETSINNKQKILNQNINKELSEINDKISDLKFRIKINENTINEMEKRIIKLNEDTNSLISKISENKKTINSLDKINTEHMNELNKIKENIKLLELQEEAEKEILNEIIIKKEKLQNQMNVIQNQLKNENNILSKMMKESNQIELEFEKQNLALNNLIVRINETYKIDITNYEIKIPDNLDYDILNTELKKLNDDLTRIGEVNLSTIDEYEKAKNRYDFMTSQLNDLIKAKADVEMVISEINSKIKKQFFETIREIDINFNSIYKELFGGGSANLIINNKDDIEKNEVEIMIQPPGKKMQNITLLSGGEKSLTAIALLFAILRTKPSPFCVLDEIDAALDEANILRFTSYLSRFKEKTQFILITHRKTSMQIAEYLYGISMQNEGISKVLSIKLDDYDEEIDRITKEA